MPTKALNQAVKRDAERFPEDLMFRLSRTETEELVPFPFTDQSATKQRPGVVVSSLAYHSARRDLILMPITSQVRGSSEFGEVMLEDWQSARLLKPSAVKPVLATFERALVRKTLGRLSTRDQQRLRECIESPFG